MTAHVPRHRRRRLTPPVRVNTHRMCPPPPCVCVRKTSIVMPWWVCNNVSPQKNSSSRNTLLFACTYTMCSQDVCALVRARTLRADSHDRGCSIKALVSSCSLFTHFSLCFICADYSSLSCARRPRSYHTLLCVRCSESNHTQSSRWLDVMNSCLLSGKSCTCSSARRIRYVVYNERTCTHAHHTRTTRCSCTGIYTEPFLPVLI